MKKSFLFFFVLLAALRIFSQSPQSMPFQGIARNANGVPIPNQLISVRLTVRDATATGTAVYQETDTVTTSSLGLFTVAVGTGTVDSGTFSSISWGGASKFMQVELDTNGHSSYLNMGTTQMLSVPYSLYSANSGNVFSKFGVSVDGGGSVVEPGFEGYTIIPYACTIRGWNIIADGTSPYCRFDIWKVAAGTTLPTSSNSIISVGSSKPILSTGNAIESTSLTNWTTTVSPGDMIGFNVDSVTVSTKLNLIVKISVP